MKKSLIALALGTFGLGMTEYVMMGILPFMARDFMVTIPEAGHFISSYALGVCVGAPLAAILMRKWPLKKMLYCLCTIMIVASAAMALCPVPQSADDHWQYLLMIAMRFVAGTPHGAYFGVGAIIANRLSKDGKAALAVAIMCSGMSVANLIGNPLGTLLTSLLSWRLVFGFASLVYILTTIAVAKWIPYMEGLEIKSVRGQFRFLKSLAPWLLIFATIFGNGGIFCWYSYISPTLTELAGAPLSWLTFVLVLAGAGMVIGNLSGGVLSDKFGPGKTGRGIDILIFLCLVAIALTAQWRWCLIPLTFLACGCLFAVSSPQQLLLLRFSQGGELMGGAMVQIAFNSGNALGAWAGGLPIDETIPSTYHYPALIGACFALGGIICYVVFCHKYENKRMNRMQH